jgi:hypothetical protein
LNEGRKFYKPFVIRTPVLSTLLILTLILIGLVEIACRRLPDAPNRGVVTNIQNGAASLGIASLEVRQEPITPSSPVEAVPTFESTPTDSASSSIETPVIPFTPGPSIREITSTET